jgi:hypothetical protein
MRVAVSAWLKMLAVRSFFAEKAKLGELSQPTSANQLVFPDSCGASHMKYVWLARM